MPHVGPEVIPPGFLQPEEWEHLLGLPHVTCNRWIRGGYNDGWLEKRKFRVMRPARVQHVNFYRIVREKLPPGMEALSDAAESYRRAP